MNVSMVCATPQPVALTDNTFWQDGYLDGSGFHPSPWKQVTIKQALAMITVTLDAPMPTWGACQIVNGNGDPVGDSFMQAGDTTASVQVILLDGANTLTCNVINYSGVLAQSASLAVQAV